jgi:transcriptional regulator with XRE-family HTH domain
MDMTQATKARRLGAKFVRHLERLLVEANARGMTQREIAEALGYERANIISMFKTGVTRVPLDKVPALAQALEADPTAMLRLWMSEYAPEILRVLDEYMDPTVSKVEREWLTGLRTMFPESLPPFDEVVEDALKPLAKRRGKSAH